MASPFLDPSGRSLSLASRKAESNSRLPKVKQKHSVIEAAISFLSNIDFAKSEIALPDKLVFVCGGKGSAIVGSPTSLRELLLTRAATSGQAGQFGSAKVLLAEDAVRALAHSHFKNLLDLEEYIAAVVQSVVLIVESPGSICELGAFVKTDEIRQKLVVILPGHLKNVPSFITNGAVDYLREYHSEAEVLGFHWRVEDGVVSAPDYILDSMLSEIPNAMQKVHKAHLREKFEAGKLGHRLYLALSFCHLLRAAKITDLKACFRAVKVSASESEIRKYLDTLVICRFLKEFEHGSVTFYVAHTHRMPLVVAFNKEAPNSERDTMRAISRIVEVIEATEPHRLEMFRDHHDVQ